MRVREVGWLIFLAGLPFSPLFFRPLDLWHGQTTWAHLWVVSLWALTLTQSGRMGIRNRPLMAWFLFVTIWSGFSWAHLIVSLKTYPTNLLLGWGHCLVIVLAWAAATQQWTSNTVERILAALAWSGVAVLAYCGLQALNLDPLFTNLETNVRGDSHPQDVIVGTVGNYTHLSAYLSLLLPTVWLQRGWGWRIVGLIATMFLGWLLLNKHSITGVIAAWGAFGWWLWHQQRGWVIWYEGLSALGIVMLFLHPSWLSFEGRLPVWYAGWKLVGTSPLTGHGLGFVIAYVSGLASGALKNWQHLHNEYLQLLVEQGVVGFGLVGWALWDVARIGWRLPKTPMVTALCGMGLAFLLICLTSFPLHLWHLGMFGLVTYCGIYVLNAEQMVRA